VWTLTVQEYVAMPLWKRACYRLYRNPFFLFGVLPLYYFIFHYRYWRPGDSSRIRWSTVRANLALVVIMIAVSLT
jgi:omega-6 fatty acid desaturase (delta-12 desaturase)